MTKIFDPSTDESFKPHRFHRWAQWDPQGGGRRGIQKGCKFASLSVFSYYNLSPLMCFGSGGEGRVRGPGGGGRSTTP